MDMDMAPCLHIITVTYFRYQNRPIQNMYLIIYHKFKDSKYTGFIILQPIFQVLHQNKEFAHTLLGLRHSAAYLG